MQESDGSSVLLLPWPSDIAHAGDTAKLTGSLEIVRCYYNFIRPHMAMKFGNLVKTPAMQTGLTSELLTFREIFL